jgi:sirohydrochlorin ferrochelatase
MRIRFAVCAVLVGVLLPRVAFAAQGILLLADEGIPAWNTHVMQLTATVDKQKPTEVAFWSATNVQAAVDRLVQRGVSEIVAVPLFIAALPSDFTSRVKSSVPLRVTAHLGGDPVVAEIILSRAHEISQNSADDVVVIVSHRSKAGSDKRWVPDLAATAQQLNRTRRFAGVVTAALPAEGSEASAEEVAQLRRLLERQIGMARRILVVPVLTSYGGTEAAIKEQLQGLAHEVAKSALMPDDRLVAWIVSRAEAAALAARQPRDVR